jgi:ABC-2 type transport system ATP-binding protein
MRELGKKQLILDLDLPLTKIPPQLASFDLEIGSRENELVYNYDSQAESTGITALLSELREAGIHFSDVKTKQSSLEEIFVGLVKRIR